MVAVTRSTKSPWKVFSGDISASSSAIIAMTTNNSISVNYIITAKGGSDIIQLHYNVLKDGTLKSNVHSKLGRLRIDVDEAEVGGNIEVTITNNESFGISYEIAVLKLLQ